MGSSSFLDLRLKEFLDAVPARTPAPGGGSVAAVAASLAAGLTAMAARFAPEDWARRAEVVGRAEELRARFEPLADADAAAYGAFMADRSAATLERTIAIPHEIATLAAELAGLAALAAEDGNPNVRGTRRPAPTWPRLRHRSARGSSRSTQAETRESRRRGRSRLPRQPQRVGRAQAAADVCLGRVRDSP